MAHNTRYTRIGWFDWDGHIQHSKWYDNRPRALQALIRCRVRWPDLKFWEEQGKPASVIELTIQDFMRQP